MAHNVLGVIGGSGFYQMKGLDKVEQVELKTPFGRPSDPFYQGRIGEIEVVFLARHGRGPSNIAVGNKFSRQRLRDEAARRDASGFGIDRGQHEGGDPAGRTGGAESVYRSHVQASRDVFRRRASSCTYRWPIRCARISRAISPVAARTGGAAIHDGGTYLCIEGPQFSTRAESNLYRSWGVERHQHDRDAGGAARARGGDVLRDAGAGDGLRLLA